MQYQDEFIGKLSGVASLRSFLALSCQQFAYQIDRLIERVFHKQDFALKSVVDSLFEHQGPLAELSVRLKLLLGLGVISAELYQDLNAVLDFKLRLSDEIEELAFSSEKVIHFIQLLHNADIEPITQLLKLSYKPDNPDSLQYQMQQMRLEKMVRSCLIIAVSEMLEQLDVDSPL